MVRRIKLAFLIALAALLLMPMAQMLTTALPSPPLDENRRLAPAPNWNENALPQAQRWFEDHYGLRGFLITWKNQIDVTLFGVSDRVYLGRDGWLFYRSVIDREKPAEEAMSDAQLDAALANFIRLRDELAARHIHLIVITNQLKDRFYPEDMPDFLRRRDPHQRFDDFRARLAALPGITFIDPTEILPPLRPQLQLFHKTDFHWTDPAATVIAQIAIAKMAALENLPSPIWQMPRSIRVPHYAGGQSREVPLFTPLTENGLFLDPAVAPQAGDIIRHAPPIDYMIYGRKPQALPPVVWYGDSFSNGFERAGVADYFSAYYRVSLTDKTRLRDVVAHLPEGTRYFVFQSIEVKLPRWPDMWN